MVQGLVKASQKLLVGLTGSFGSGKSTLTKIFEKLGAFTIDADKLAHEALQKGAPMHQSICRIFPEAIDVESGDLNRREIAKVVFKDQAKRKVLEELVHPYVFERILEEVGLSSKEIIFVEVPLLFESGFDQYCHKTLVVETPKEIIFERLEKKGVSKKETQARLDAQMPMAEKKGRADFILDNSHNLNETKREAEKIWKKCCLALKGEI